MPGKNPKRPFKNESLKSLRSLVSTVQQELAHRKSEGARKLREKVDPDYAAKRARDCRVYVIELSDDVRKDPKFSEANPTARADLPCLYVGSTCLTAQARFKQHRDGKQKSSKRVKEHGMQLRPEFTEVIPLMTRSDAESTERRLAEVLRREGYAVWQA